MKLSKIVVAFTIVAAVVVWSLPLGAQSLKGREVLGVRVGGLVTMGPLNREFGDGSELEIHFIHGIADWLGVDVALSSHNFGASLDEAKNLKFFNLTDVNLQIFAITVGMVGITKVHGRVLSTFEAGPGLYSVNAIIPEGFYDAQMTDNRLGLYCGTGVLVKVANSFWVDLNAKYHAVFVGTGSNDTVHFYTGESTARFFQISVGIMIAAG
jgi:hypothetical protein